MGYTIHMPIPRSDVTHLLKAWSQEDEDASARPILLLFDKLLHIARRQLEFEKPSTLSLASSMKRSPRFSRSHTWNHANLWLRNEPPGNESHGSEEEMRT